MGSSVTFETCSCLQKNQDELFHGARTPFFLLHCRECGCGITSPWPTETQLNAAYSSEYYSSDSAKFNSLIEAWTRYAASRRAGSLLRKHGANNRCRVLDYGCGRGVLLEGFKAQGVSVLGLEREGSGFDAIPDVTVSSLDDLLATDEKFDIVVIWHVLEHLQLPQEDLVKVEKLLAPGGSLFIEVPNFGSWQARLFGRHWFHLDFPRHLYHFTARSLQTQLESANLQLVSKNTYALTSNSMVLCRVL